MKASALAIVILAELRIVAPGQALITLDHFRSLVTFKYENRRTHKRRF